jgi:phosphoenolpyruvate carboxykinase (GTP)
MELTNNNYVLDWINQMAALTTPDTIVWVDGSDEQLDEIRAVGMRTGEMIRLNEEKLPGCFLHRSDKNDVARVEDRTFICCKNQKDAGPTNNWMDNWGVI